MRTVLGMLCSIWFIGIIVARSKRAASIARRAVRRCDRCRKNAARVISVAMRSRVEGEKVIEVEGAMSRPVRQFSG